ncbi:MAG: UMP kinase [Candidatus Onthovivens sp.]|nr:UMP kinase [Mollicutes bacterium]MDD7546623.1 UMP kinase [Bacilli bacterium]MDY3761908.1 UMP kinase [Candidatus Onthovivens sp.]MCI6614462.1 UMP kinase [Mollicutes bacterium]MCI7040443.1 UMP kinase [Mollicutes bacterium]
MEPKYKKVILKLSGEAIADSSNSILNPKKLSDIVSLIETLFKCGVKVGVVIGAGNIFRGRIAVDNGIDTESGDYMGMIGTVINLKAISSLLNQRNIPNVLYSALNVENVTKHYDVKIAKKEYENSVVLLAGGIGKPNFTTDTCAALRAVELDAELILAGKYGVKGVYDKDPRLYKDAKFLKKLTYQEVLDMDLKVMDKTAISLLLHSNVITKVFSMDDMNNFILAIEDKDIGTIIKEK